MPFMSAQRWFSLGKETDRGVGVDPTLWLPIAPNPTLEPKVTWLKDEGLRGSPDKQYGAVPGFRHDEFDFKGNVFADTFPALLQGILGSSDTVAGTGPYTHSIGLLNDPSTGSQPPSYTLYDVDNLVQGSDSAKMVTDGQLDIEFTADGAMTYSAKYLGDAFSYVVPPDITFSDEIFIPAWSAALTIGTVDLSVVMKGSISIKRNVQPIYTLGTQSPYRLFADAIDVQTKFTFVSEANDVFFGDALVSDPVALTFTFTDPVSGHSVEFTMSSVQLMNPKTDSSKNWIEVSTDGVALANTTDAILGYAPIQTVTTNAQSTAY